MPADGYARWCLVVLLCLLCGEAAASERPPLPEPLTLGDALALADGGQPGLELGRAAMERADAGRLDAEALSGLEVRLEARLRAVEPSYRSPDPDNNDSSVALRLRKRLLDFGRSEAAEQAALEAGAGKGWEFLEARQRQRLTIMERFFDVLLADAENVVNNEALAVAYIQFDKARQRAELGRLSDVEVARIESEYQQVRLAYTESQGRQRAARARLALALGRPDELSAKLAEPSLPMLELPRPELDLLKQEMLAGNPRLLALRAEVKAAEQRLAEARALDGPVIYGELELADYNRPTASTHPAAVGLTLELPMSDGGRAAAERGRRLAELHERRARLAEAEQEMGQQLLELWLKLDRLRVERDQVAALGRYRELYLDRSRALYELEVASDLGDSMARISESNLAKQRADYATALAWAEIDALRGRLIKGKEATIAVASEPKPSGAERDAKTEMNDE